MEERYLIDFLSRKERNEKMFREKITRQYSSLSPSFQRIADFILASHQRAAFLSASRLAKQVEVDVATVTRFAQQLGYEGYVELVREIQEVVLQEMQECRAPASERLQSAGSPFIQALWRDWANLESTIQALSSEHGQQAVAALARARRVYLVGEGFGAALAAAAQQYLQIIRPDTVLLDRGAFETAMELKEMGAEDVVVGIGFTHYAHMSTHAILWGNKVGATTIGVIAQADCPIGAHAQILLASATPERGYLPSMTSVAAILFALIYSVCLRDDKAYRQKLAEFQKAYADLSYCWERGEEEALGLLRLR
jgi:DNA-binding MurR/RpiR family transcriptional regulator